MTRHMLLTPQKLARMVLHQARVVERTRTAAAEIQQLLAASGV